MPSPPGTPKPLLLLGSRFVKPVTYSTKGQPPPRGKDFSRADLQLHGEKLLTEIGQIQQDYQLLHTSWLADKDIKTRGIIIEIEVPRTFAEDTASLERKKMGLQLLNQRPLESEEGILMECQTWFVPDGALEKFEQMLQAYLHAGKTRHGKRQYERLVTSIERISLAALNELWTETEPLPVDDSDTWWEAWLRAGTSSHDRAGIEAQFRKQCSLAGLAVGPSHVILPEHTIVAVQGQFSKWSHSMALLNCMAELRLGRDFAGFFDGLPPEDQTATTHHLLERLAPEPAFLGPFDQRVAVCVMDTGVNRGHPLLRTRLPEAWNLTIREEWTASDHHGHTGHGTGMCGIVLYGDLTLAALRSGVVPAPFVLEAVKIVPPPQYENSEERLAAAFTQSGVYLLESIAPFRKRIWCVATTLAQPDVRGRPGSWSAALDMLACGLDDSGGTSRLFCLSAGNVLQEHWHRYPESNHGISVHPPGQAWNALVIGSFTLLDQTRNDKDQGPTVALRGGMAPTNSTSLTWDHLWPNRPDIVFEGGNAAKDSSGGSWQVPDLGMLTTAANFPTSPFTVVVGTSPATALASRMAAQILANYPDLWPESVRGLMVHSACWTPAMTSTVGSFRKSSASQLLRTVGYGVPSITSAMECATSRATMIVQAQLQPFIMKSRPSEPPSFHQLHLHTLPWPDSALSQTAPHQRVRMRVTLSYFIEPNPGNRGYSTSYRYANCQLRFRVSAAGQSPQDLMADVDKGTDEELGNDHVKGDWDGWHLDQDHVSKGSVHSNWWEGSAADLLSKKHLLVYPISGWWKTRKVLGRADSTLRYSLIVTLESANPELDLYTEISQRVALPSEIAT